jgi:Na+/melibiose symporter-like transporter
MRLSLNPDFDKLWVAQAVSSFGSKITREVLAYIAVLTLIATPAEMSILSVAGAVPVLLVGLFVGVWVDRLPRRPLMIVADLARAVALSAIPLAALTHSLQVWLLYVVAALMGIFSLVFDVADRSYLPSIVQSDKLLEANSRLSITGSLSEVGGPALAGLLVQIISAPFTLALDVLSFLWSAFWLGLIRTPESPLSPEEGQDTPDIWRETREGIATLWSNINLRTLAVVAFLHNFFGWFFGTLYVYFAVRELGLSSGVVGLLISAGGVGALIGAASAERLARRFGLGRILVLSACTVVVVELLVPLASGPLVVILIFMLLAQFVGDIAWEIYAIGDTSLRQMSVAPRLMGRVTATMSFLSGGAGPFGAVAAGVLASATSARLALFVAVAGFGLAALWLALSPLRNFRLAPASSELNRADDLQ